MSGRVLVPKLTTKCVAFLPEICRDILCCFTPERAERLPLLIAGRILEQSAFTSESRDV